MNIYKTIKNNCDVQIIEKKSKFIAHIRSVAGEDDCISFIEEMKKTYWDATHNVYAYVLTNNQISKYSDDKELSGTAGVPVLEVLKKNGIYDAIIVVTRYFGGTLLGAGGLIRAYSKSAKSAVEMAQIVTMKRCEKLELCTDYAFWGKIDGIISNFDGKKIAVDYSDNVKCICAIPIENVSSFQKELMNVTFGTIQILVEQQAFYEFPN